MEKEENKNKSILIRKASGVEESFKVEKLKKSMRNAGAEEEVIEQVANDIGSWIYDGITTQKIYARAFFLLRKNTRHVASRYKLKNAIMELGPTGYPFEHFIGKIMEIQGYYTKVNQLVEGFCVSHELDVVATRNKEQVFVECKYGQSPGKSVNVQVPLYIRSRVDDIIQKRKENKEFDGFSFSGKLVTNTRFTTDAIDYGKCSGLRLLSWDYPSGNGLKDIIDRNKIYPVTVLHNLTKNQKQILLERGIVICRQVKDQPEVLEEFRLSKNQFSDLMEELEEIL